MHKEVQAPGTSGCCLAVLVFTLIQLVPAAPHLCVEEGSGRAWWDEATKVFASVFFVDN